MFSRTTLISTGVALVLAACAQPEGNVSQVRHDEDTPVRGPRPAQWAELTTAQYDELIAPLIQAEPGDFLPPDHELTRRSQAWVDTLDARLRAAHPAELRQVPKPVARVLKDPSANAFVTTVPVCYEQPVKVQAGALPSQRAIDAVLLDVATGELAELPSDFKCAPGSDGRLHLEAALTEFNAKSPACRYGFDAAGNLQSNGACKLDESLRGVAQARQVAIMQTANFITVHTGIFPLMTEEAFVAVLAHELGHYYRAHAVAPQMEYDYFYTMPETPMRGRPRPEPERRQLGEAAILGSTLLSASDSYGKVEGQKVRSEFFFAMGSLVDGVCRGGSCPSACEDAASLMGSAEFVEAIGRFPFGDATEEQQEAYGRFEPKALACLGEIKMAPQRGLVEGPSLSWDRFRLLMTQPTWPTWARVLSPRSQRSLGKLNALAAARTGQNHPESPHLAAALLKVSQTFTEQDQESEQLLREAHRARLGYYTVEQEADDVAAEWIADIGIPPSASVEAMRRLGQGLETSMRGYSLGQSDCERLWQRKWTSENGSYLFVPVGDYSEIHHSTCFRMFNLDREIRAHVYQPTRPSLPLLSAAGWSQLQGVAMVAAGPESGRVRRGVRQVHERARHRLMTTCPYASDFH